MRGRRERRRERMRVGGERECDREERDIESGREGEGETE